QAPFRSRRLFRRRRFCLHYDRHDAILYSGSTGRIVVFVADNRIVTTHTIQLASQEAGEAGWEPGRPITSKDTDPEPDASQLARQLRGWDQPLVVDLFGAAVELTESPKADDPATQEPAASILRARHQYGPIRPLPEYLPGASPGHAAGPGRVEEQQSPW